MCEDGGDIVRILPLQCDTKSAQNQFQLSARLELVPNITGGLGGLHILCPIINEQGPLRRNRKTALGQFKNRRVRLYYFFNA